MIRREIQPAMLGSVLLHATVAIALLISWNFARDLKVGSVVPVTIVSKAPAADVRKAEQAPVEQTALADEPVPQAPLESTPPAPQPKPAPPPPTPKPTPTPAKPIPAPAPVKPAPPAKPEKSLDLDALSASISKMQKPATPKPSSAAKGPARPETALQARPALGAAASAAALSGLADELQRRWNPNCDVEGGRDVQVKVYFTIGAGAQVVGDVTTEIQTAHTPVARTAAERAVRAVYAAAPFRDLPREFYGQKIKVNFDAQKACS
ncbi:energy transducer TonB [Phenylobacterium sp.]|uniref:energy transducer TonB n=1 Tax=Phenylobacterium sp. TaxID=1871053 RepID=UPI0035646566